MSTAPVTVEFVRNVKRKLDLAKLEEEKIVQKEVEMAADLLIIAINKQLSANAYANEEMPYSGNGGLQTRVFNIIKSTYEAEGFAVRFILDDRERHWGEHNAVEIALRRE